MAELVKKANVEARDVDNTNEPSDPKAATDAQINKVKKGIGFAKGVDLAELFKRSRENEDTPRPKKPVETSADALKNLGLLEGFQKSFPGKSFEIKTSVFEQLTNPPSYTATVTLLIRGGGNLNIMEGRASWDGKFVSGQEVTLLKSREGKNKKEATLFNVPPSELRFVLEGMLDRYNRTQKFDRKPKIEDTLNPV